MSSTNSVKNYGFVVAETEEQAREKIIARYPELKDRKITLRQDADCLDTWFSSWLWPLSVFDGINRPENPDICYYYPTADLVTGPDIIFFWVARMIMAGEEFRAKEPFRNVYFTGIVRDKLGRKMSKQLGNSPDPIELMNRYGADGVRMGMLLSAPAGNDIHFDEALCEQGRNFCNKIWNAFRLIQSWTETSDIKVDYTGYMPKHTEIAVEWFANLLENTKLEVEDLFSKYRLSEALMLIYKVFWDDFCAWYLEIAKPEYGKIIDVETYSKTKGFFEELLKLLHPFMPFITEELYHEIYKREEGESIMTARLEIKKLRTEKQKEKRNKILADFEKIKEIITNIRNIRASKNISPKEKLTLQVSGEHEELFDAVIQKLANVEIVPARHCGLDPQSPVGSGDSDFRQNDGITEEKSAVSVSFLVGTAEYAVPVGNLINAAEEIDRMEKEIQRLEGFLKSINAKLSNERFVAGAKPEIVETERKKQSDALAKIASLQESIKGLKN